MEFNYEGVGGFDTAGSGAAAPAFVVDLPVLWGVKGEILLEHDFEWNIGQAVLHYYQVEGECADSHCQTTTIEPNDSKCGGDNKQRLIEVVPARNVADLCRRLQRKFLNYPTYWRIAKVRKHSRPVYLDDIRDEEARGINHSCNTLTDQEFEQVDDCAIFTLRQAGIVEMGMSVSIQQDFLGFIASGGIVLGGSASFSVQTSDGTITYRDGIFALSAVGSGGIVTAGTSDITSTVGSSEGSGGILTGGTAEWSSAASTYIASGGISLSGSSIDSTSSSHETTASGGLTLSGAGIYIAGYQSSTKGGNVKLSGSGIYALQEIVYAVDGTGGISISGDADVVSSAYSWTGDGGIAVSGSYTNAYSFTFEGGITLGGSAAAHYGPHPLAAGGTIYLAGATEYGSTAYSWEGSGGIMLDGTGETVSSWQGLLTVWMGLACSLQYAEIMLPAPKTYGPLTSLAEPVVTDCGCRGMPHIFGLSHNLNQSQQFAYFLNRNGLTLPSQTTIRYRSSDRSWRNNFSFMGTGKSGNQEKWSVLFEWGCVAEIAGAELATPMWQLSVRVQKKDLDENVSSETRLLAAFNIEADCLRDEFDFPVTVNTRKKIITTTARSSVDYQIVHDEIGMFQGEPFYSKPTLNIRISEILPTSNKTSYDYSGFIPDRRQIPEAAFR